MPVIVTFLAVGAGAANLTNATDFELRAAVSAGGVVNLFGTNVIELTNTLGIIKDVVIDGTGGNVTLRREGNRAIDIGAGVVVLRGITVSNSGGDLNHGGALRNSATATVERCTFVGNLATNTSGSGAAIYNAGTLFVNDGTFIRNTGLMAGAIMNAGKATIQRTTFEENKGTAVANGDVFKPSVFTAITNCTFGSNEGAAFVVVYQNFGPYGPSWISHCTFAGNTSYELVVYSPQLGGPIPPVFVNNSAFSSNSVGIANYGFDDLGGNASSEASPLLTNATSFSGVDLKLGPLAMNGGPARTMLPQPGSPLIDRLPPQTSAAVDQRGVTRPFGPLSDIGAVESAANPGDAYFAVAAYDVGEAAGSVTVNVSRLQGSPGSGTVEFFTTAETAVAGADFVSTNGVLSFAEGETTKAVTVGLLDDAVSETQKTFRIGLRNPAGAVTLSAATETRVRITDNEVFILTDCTLGGLLGAMSNSSWIRFSCDATIVLTNTIVVTGSLTVDGGGHAVTLSGGGARRLFDVQANARLQLNDLTLSNGFEAAGQGGAIRNRGQVVATECRFSANMAMGATGTAGVYMSTAAGTGGNAEGGAIWNENADLLLTNVLFSGNRIIGGTGGPYGTLQPPAYGGPGGMASGGAIHALFSRVVAVGCTFETNRAVPGSPGQGSGRTASSGVARGGAITAIASDVILSNVVMHGQIAGGTGVVNHALGGAIYQERGTLSAFGSTFSNNVAAGGSGVVNSSSALPGGNALGGALVYSNALSLQPLRFIGCTFVYNRAIGGAQVMGQFGEGYAGSGRGGAIYSARATAFTNCTFAHNTASGGALFSSSFSRLLGEGQGGAIFVATGVVSAIHCTIASNIIARSQSPSTVAPSLGGSAIFANDDTHPSIQNTILASAPGLQTCYGPLTDLGGNLSSDVYADLTHPASLSNVDPKLSPLGDYGGPTLTMALLEGSPAIDAAYMTANPLATDQRGRPRPTSAGADIGPFESTPPFTLRGQLVGYPSTAGIRVNVGGSNVVSDAAGNYSLAGLSSGTIQVSPSHTNWVSDPLWRDVNVTRDTVGVNFEFFFKGLATLQKLSPTALRVSYASRDPRVIVAETSSNLLEWIPVATNYTGLLLHVNSPIEPGSRFFRFSEGLPIPP